MPQVLPPAGSDGLPNVSTRAFQLIDAGYSVWEAVYYAFSEYIAALVQFFGATVTDDIGQIGF